MKRDERVELVSRFKSFLQSVRGFKDWTVKNFDIKIWEDYQLKRWDEYKDLTIKYGELSEIKETPAGAKAYLKRVRAEEEQKAKEKKDKEEKEKQDKKNKK